MSIDLPVTGSQENSDAGAVINVPLNATGERGEIRVGATVSDLEGAAKDLGVSQSDVDACRNP